MSYFLGIDGGGSKTTCVLGDESKVVATATTGGSNIVRVGEGQARAALEQGVRDVCKAAAITPSQITAVCAGIAGAASEDARQQLAAMLNSLVTGHVEVVGDMAIAHEAALGRDPGIVVLAGTGSIAYGRHASGCIARAGGWGFAVSDEGSGHWIGMQAVAALAQARDAGSHTTLSDRILQRWKVASFDQLMREANASPPPDFAGLFPDVVASAESGDSYARDILERAGTELAGLAVVVFRRLWESGDEISVALAGGVLQNSAVVRDSFQSELKSSLPQARVFLSEVSAAEGALSRARKRRR